MSDALPEQLTEGAILHDNEYAWELTAFPEALATAPQLGYACLGGQFWYLLADNSVCELYWLDADSTDRSTDESWSGYVARSCVEVLSRFNALTKETDFTEEARKFDALESVLKEDSSSRFRVLFNAYFVSEQEFVALRQKTEIDL